jgi:WD40 repeat protein
MKHTMKLIIYSLSFAMFLSSSCFAWVPPHPVAAKKKPQQKSNPQKTNKAVHSQWSSWPSNPFRKITVTQFPIFLDSISYLPQYSFSENGKMIVFMSGKNVEIWNPQEGKRIKILSAEPANGKHDEKYIDYAISPDGRLLAMGYEYKHYEQQMVLIGSGSAFQTVERRYSKILIWDIESDKSVRTLSFDEPLKAIAFSPDSKSLVAGSRSGKLRFWDSMSGRCIRTLSYSNRKNLYPGAFSVGPIAFSLDGKIIAACGWDGEKAGTGKVNEITSVKIWDMKSGQCRNTLSPKVTNAGDNEEILAIALSPDGKFQATAKRDILEIWDVQSGKRLKNFPVTYSSMIFSRDGDFLLAASRTTSIIQIWDRLSGWEPTATLRGNQIIASTESGILMTVSNKDKAIQFWQLPNVP